MRVFILTLLLTVLASFTTVTLAFPNESKGLVIATIASTFNVPHLNKITTDELKIEPRWVTQDLLINSFKTEKILHIDPGQYKKGFYNSNLFLIDTRTEKILHIDPGNEGEHIIFSILPEISAPAEKNLHIDPGRK